MFCDNTLEQLPSLQATVLKNISIERFNFRKSFFINSRMTIKSFHIKTYVNLDHILNIRSLTKARTYKVLSKKRSNYYWIFVSNFHRHVLFQENSFISSMPPMLPHSLPVIKLQPNSDVELFPFCVFVSPQDSSRHCLALSLLTSLVIWVYTAEPHSNFQWSLIQVLLGILGKLSSSLQTRDVLLMNI